MISVCLSRLAQRGVQFSAARPGTPPGKQHNLFSPSCIMAAAPPAAPVTAFTDPKGEVESTARTIAVQCPHCVADNKEDWECWIEVDRNEINCKIFRHGCMRIPYVQRGIIVPIPPHASKVTCDAMAAQGAIIGCGKPYRVVVTTQEGGGRAVRAVVCEYV